MKKSRFVWVVMLLVALPVVLFSCLGSDVEPPNYDQMLADNLATVNQTQLAIDKQIIDDSLAKWQVQNVVIDPSGVRYTIETLGTGQKPVLTSFITCKYEGRLLKNGQDGPTFDEGDALQIYLYSLIMGWQTTLPKIPKGSKATLYIPSGLGYGNIDVKNPNTGNIVIPKNSNLIFEIELDEVL